MHQRKFPAAPNCLGVTLLLTGLFVTSFLIAQSSGNKITLQKGMNGYNGAEDFYTYHLEGGVFNSKTDLDAYVLKVDPLNFDTKFVIRFDNIPISPSSGTIYRVALVLTLAESPNSDTLLAHNLNPGDVWNERQGNYNSLNGTAPWSGINGKLIEAWNTIDAIATITGGEDVGSKVVFEFYPQDFSARRALLDSWLDRSNQGIVIEGVNAKNVFHSSDAFNPADRPELIIEYAR